MDCCSTIRSHEPNIHATARDDIYSSEVRTQDPARAGALRRTEPIYRSHLELFCDCTGDSRLGLERARGFRVGTSRATSTASRSHPDGGQ